MAATVIGTALEAEDVLGAAIDQDDLTRSRDDDHTLDHSAQDATDLLALLAQLEERSAQASAHVVQIALENSELIAARDRQARREVAAGDGAREIDHVLEASADRVGDV